MSVVRSCRLIDAIKVATLLSFTFVIDDTALISPWSAGRALAVENEKPQLKLNILPVEQIEIRNLVVGTGTIAPTKSSDIGALVEGQVTEIYVHVGDRLEKDGPLFQIRPHTYRFKVDEAKAHLAMARARAAEAQNAFRRSEELYKGKTVSASVLDKARSAIGVANAEVLAATARLENADQDLTDTQVLAPFKGVVTARRADEGVYLSTRLSGGTGQTVVQLQKIDVVMAIIRVPARALERVRVASSVRLDIDGISQHVEAKISVINDKVDVATRTIEVRVAIPNEDYAIKPGLFVRAEIRPDPRIAIVVPRSVILGDPSNPYVFVLRQGRAIRKNVRVDDHDATKVEVTSGLNTGERVISGPDMRSVVDGIVIGEVSDVAG